MGQVGYFGGRAAFRGGHRGLRKRRHHLNSRPIRDFFPRRVGDPGARQHHRHRERNDRASEPHGHGHGG